MLEQIRHQLKGWFVTRRQIDQNTEGILVSSVAKNIKNYIDHTCEKIPCSWATDLVYEVFSIVTMSAYIVRLDNETFTYYEWQASGIPCGHTLAVSLERNDDPQTYAKAFFRLDAYRGTYKNLIFPLNVNAATTADEPNVDSSEDLPPIICHPLERLRKLRIWGPSKEKER